MPSLAIVTPADSQQDEDSERPPLLSVIIPNYNHGAHIAEAVAAAATQSRAPDEIIVVDDASTDDSLAVLDGLRARYSQLRVVALPKNGGAIHALNRGLAEARGTYVYFGAADDLSKPGLFETMLDLALAHPEAAFACGEGDVVDMDTGRTSHRPPVRPSYAPRHFTPAEVAETFRRIDNWMLTGAAVVRRDLMAEAGGFDPALGAMADGYALRRLALVHGCCFAPFSGLVWQVRASGLSRAQAADSTAGLGAIRKAISRMKTDPAFPSWYPDMFERRWRFAVSRIATQSEPMNADVLAKIGARGPLGKRVLAASAAIGGPVGRMAALAWLTIVERPTSFAGLIATYLSRSRLLA